MVEEKSGKTNKPRLSKEELLEKRVKMAKERGSRVARINSPLGHILFNVLRQFDQAYTNLKGRIGEPGGISFEDGAEIMERAGKISYEFSKLTKDLSRKVKFQYFTPDELKAFSAHSQKMTHTNSKKIEKKEEDVLEVES